MNQQKYQALHQHIGQPSRIVFNEDDDCIATVTVGEEEAEYLILTDDEANDKWDEALERYIDDCLEIPVNILPYFDREGWKSDARMDGRGHALSMYDGVEDEQDVDGTTYYIYRTN